MVHKKKVVIDNLAHEPEWMKGAWEEGRVIPINAPARKQYKEYYGKDYDVKKADSLTKLCMEAHQNLMKEEKKRKNRGY